MKITEYKPYTKYCHLCGQSMEAWTVEDELHGTWHLQFCTVEPLHHKYDIHLLEEWQRLLLEDIELITKAFKDPPVVVAGAISGTAPHQQR